MAHSTHSRRALPPLGRKDSKGSSEEPTRISAKSERTRQDSKGSSEGRRRSTSISQAEAPTKPLVPLRVRIDVEDSHQDVVNVMLEPLGSPEDLAIKYRIQWRFLLAEVLDQDEGSKDKEFVDVEGVQVQDQCIVIPVQQKHPGLLQLRVFQKDLPDSIAAWNDWGRAARKDCEWLSRLSLPSPVDVPAPAPPRATVEVSRSDGSSLVVFLKWAVPLQMSSWIKSGILRWQYRCRDATFGQSEDWYFETLDSTYSEEDLWVQSPPLRGEWDHASAVFSVRYCLVHQWSKWSESLGCSSLPPKKEPLQISVSQCDARFTEAVLALKASATNDNVKALQCRIELQDGGWKRVTDTELPFEAQFSCRLLHLRPGERYTVRVSSRRWRIDPQWQEQYEEFKQPLTGSEYGIPPPRAVADDMLGPAELNTGEPCESMSARSFWLPAMVATWAAESSFVEWRMEDGANDSSWQLCPFQRPSLRMDLRKDSRFASGSGLRVLLPKVVGRILLRLRHACGLVTSPVVVFPHLTPPPKPTASLVVKDSGLAVQLHIDGLEKHGDATMLQFMSSSEEEEENSTAQGEELPMLSIAGGIREQYLVDLEELSQRQRQLAFCARIGNSCQMSAWSVPSDFIAVGIPPPVPSGELTVRELEKGAAQVAWPSFQLWEGLTQVIYEVAAICSCCPEESKQLILSERQALENGSDGLCQAVFTRLVPDTEYDFVVRGVYPNLQKHIQEDTTGSASTLKATLRLSGVDSPEFEPPLPVQQVAPPPLHGGADRRSPWSLEFWLEADDRAMPSANEAPYMVEWRPWSADDLQWQKADLELAQTAGVQSAGQGLVLCTWQFPDAVKSPPDAVEFRVRKVDFDGYVVDTSSRTWLSQVSGPFATAFATPEKPRASLLVGPDLQVVLAFSLHSESQNSDEKMTNLKPGHGHALVTRIQVSYRQAGDAHVEEVHEMKPQNLASVCADGCAVKIHTLQPQFLDGQRVLFAVRVGDDWRWSHWSSFSKPVHMKHPILQPAKDPCLVVKPLSLDRAWLRYPSVATETKELVEYFVSMAQMGPTGREVRSTSQLIALQAEKNPKMHAGNEMEIYVGCQRGMLQFKLLARSQCHQLGAPVFQEIARSDPVLWPSCLDAAESWDLPMPRPLCVPDLEATSGRWRSRALLLAWPKGVQLCEDPPLELQACAWREPKQGEDGQESVESSLGDTIDPTGWVAVSWSLIQVHGLPCVAASQLPFSCCRLRWYSCDRRIAGPYSEACLTFIDCPVEVTSRVFCTISAVKVQTSFEFPSLSNSVTFCQWRYGSVKPDRTDDGVTWSEVEEWQVLDPTSCVSTSGRQPSQQSFCVGEEDGLELGCCYVFSVRIGDGRRSSLWSSHSAPVMFDVPDTEVPAPMGAGPHKLLIEPLTSHTVRCWWPTVQAPEMQYPCGYGFGRPSLEYRLDVSRCVADGGLERHCTILLSDDDSEEEDVEENPYANRSPCDAYVNGLSPGVQYFASLAVRFSMLGRRDWRRTGITASFQTS